MKETAIVIKDNEKAKFVAKKLFRLSSAVHLITQFLEEKEPIRRRLREMSLILPNLLLRGGSLEGVHRRVSSRIEEMVLLLKTAEQGDILSEMNGGMLRRAYESIGSELSQNALDLDEITGFEEKDILVKSFPYKTEGFHKRTVIKDSNMSFKTMSVRNVQDRLSYRKDVAGSSKKESVPREGKRERKKTSDEERVKKIIDAVKEKGKVNIKDISMVIRDVSEKTIQRDILSLISSGILQKTGERRWSTYSLNSQFSGA
ncbi:MAG: DeoR family transcriptional regulator [Patescibacteria group bacterium]